MFTNDIGRRINSDIFMILGINAVIAEKREGLNDGLSLICGVGKRLNVTDH